MNRLGLVFLFCFLAGAAGAAGLAPGDHELSLIHGQLRRSYIVHVPPQAASGRPLSAVLNFHGGGAHARAQKEYSRMDAAADREGIRRILTVGNTGGPKFEIDNRYIFGKHLNIIGSTMGTKKDFADVFALIFAGKLRPVIDKTFPMAEVRAAHERLEKGEQLGGSPKRAA